jgi:hypothetical protein
MRKIFLATAILLACCREERPPTPSTTQNEQLNEAEDMLNGMAANEEGPADRSASPSNRSN